MVIYVCVCVCVRVWVFPSNINSIVWKTRPDFWFDIKRTLYDFTSTYTNITAVIASRQHNIIILGPATTPMYNIPND